MKSINLENYYSKINKKILLAEAYTEQPTLGFIIKMCRLKPAEYSTKLCLERKWIDEYGNSLNILKNKKIRIVENDLTIDKNNLVCTDLYSELPLSKISKVSKLVYVLSGKDEDFQEDYLIISFLGIDNYLRTYYLYNGQFELCSPLNLGTKVLKFIVENKDIKYFIESNNKDFVLFPCLGQKSWLSFWPASKQFTEIINKNCELFSHLIN